MKNTGPTGPTAIPNRKGGNGAGLPGPLRVMKDHSRLAGSKDPKVKELYDKLIQGIRQTLEKGDWAEFLQFAARFHKYSFHNTVLIWSQKPDATLVAGMKAWNEMGRRVKKGEKGIAIYAPRVVKTKEVREEVDPDTLETRTVEVEVERVVGFKVVYVWDVSQTEGKPLPKRPEIPKVADTEAAVFLWDRLLKVCPVPVVLDAKGLPDGATGVFIPNKRIIYIRPDLPPGARASALLHEMGHALAWDSGLDGWEYRAGKEDGYVRGEALAEGAAFIAGQHLGLDTSHFSFVYVAAWAKDVNRVLEWGSDVQKLAARFIEVCSADAEAA